MSIDVSIVFLPHMTILERNEDKDARKRIGSPDAPSQGKIK